MDEAVKGWAQFGVLGLVVIALMYAVIALWKAYNECQEKRIQERGADSKAAYDALLSITQPLQKIDQTLSLILGLVQNIKGGG